MAGEEETEFSISLIDLDSITIYVVSKIARQFVDPFPVKVKSPFVYTAGVDIFV